MIVPDSNVVSELLKHESDDAVQTWVRAVGLRQLWPCSVVVGELTFGALRLPPGRRRSGLLHRLTQLLGEGLDGRLLTYGSDEALAFGRLKAVREKAGRPAGDVDVMIAATALVHGATVATRNVRHFEGFGVEVVNPWRT